MDRKLSILIVDDDYKMAKTLHDILKAKKYKPQIAQCGQEALDKIRKNSFNWVITDIKMPGMNGIEVCEAVKYIQPEVSVLFMSAYTTNEKKLKESAVAILTKPLDINYMLSVLSSLPS